ncbi:hypothetical protein [Moraxella ovis]|uniref:hypothetical protein n=1 Tax=Moraxella ovis TaxID=29433 RepID=UPI000DD5A6EF|nr:hypothetical protein [Moraxella ovis]
MKKLLLAAFISAFALSASASEPAQSKSAHLLAPEYQDLSALTDLGNLDAMSLRRIWLTLIRRVPYYKQSTLTY